MDNVKRRLMERNLQEAERHVTESEALIEGQRTSIDERRRDGHDVELAVDLLDEMEESQRVQVMDRDRQLRDLPDAS